MPPHLPGSYLVSLTVNSSLLPHFWQRGYFRHPLALSFRRMASLEIQFDMFESDHVAMLEDIVEENHASLCQVRLNFALYAAMLQRPDLDLIAALHRNPALEESLLADLMMPAGGGAPRGLLSRACQDLKKRHPHLRFVF